MNVLVLIRRLVRGPDGARAPSLLGTCDEAALRAGLALRAAGAEVTVIAAGPAEREDEVLEHALVRGAGRAVRISDPCLEGVDYHGMARVLAQAARHVGFELILVGDRSGDEGQGAVGPAVAEALGVPHVTAALDLRLEDGAVLVQRRDRAHVRTLRLPVPLLVTVARSTADAGAAHARPHGAIEALGLHDLGVQAPELRPRLHCVGRTVSRDVPGATMLAHADELIARLRDDRLIP
jgi:electron transfer flavoprotein beta subunit